MRRFFPIVIASLVLAAAPLQPISADEETTANPGVLATLDDPTSMSRLVLFEQTSASFSETVRSRIEADAKDSMRTVTWIPFDKQRFEREMKETLVASLEMSGVTLTSTTYNFPDPANVTVVLDVTMLRSSQEQSLIDAANNVLKSMQSGESREINFGARPGEVKIQIPDSSLVLKAINDDLAQPERRLAGCSLTQISFVESEGSRGAVAGATVAFKFQEEGVITSIQETLGRLGFEDWQEVRPIEAGFKVQPPDMSSVFANLQQALREDDRTDLAVILCDVTVEPSKDAPEQMIMNLDGFVSIEQIKPFVVDVANDVADEFFAPYMGREEGAVPINVQPSNLTLRPTSRSASYQFVRLAHRYTQEHRFEEAVKALESAAFEDKQAMNTMYWLAVSHLRLGNEGDARRILKRTVRKNARLIEEARLGTLNEYRELMHVLEPVQGALRRHLHELEGQVYAEYCRKTRRRS